MRLDLLRRPSALLPLLLLPLVLPGPACRASDALHPAESRASLHAPRVEPVDVEHYSLDLELDPESETIQATCTVRLWAVEGGLRSVALDLEGLEVSGVRDGAGRELQFTHRGGRLEVRLPRPLGRGDFVELAIRYGGRPAKGLFFAGHRAGRSTHVFTQGECEDARWWFPCLDYPADRATSELRVTMPAHWTSVAAGELIDRRIEGGRRVEHWRMSFPHPTYLVTLVAGELVTREASWDGVPLLYLSEPGFEPWMEAAFAETEQALDFLTDFTGMRYPFPKYSQACVENFPFGGMENISATTLTRKTLTDERGSRDRDSTGLVVHEAAHQWFGNMLTCRDWSHIWLNEGFATYFTMLYFEHTRGIDDFRVRLRDAQDSYVAADQGEGRRPMVHAVYRDPIDLFFSGHAYAGGAVRLHLLRHVLGERDFQRGIRLYVADNLNRGVVTDDLRRALEEASGRDLGRFFAQWFYSPGFPSFAVAWRYDERQGEVLLTVEQVQDPGDGTPAVFELPVDVEVRTEGEARVHRVELSQRREVFRLPAASPPLWVRFDAGGAIPKELALTRPLAEWRAMARLSDDVNARRDALAALVLQAGELGEAGAELVREELGARLVEDPVPAVRIAAAQGLSKLPGGSSRERLVEAASTDPRAAVRVAALAALEVHGADAELAGLAERAFEEGYSWAVMAAAAGLRAAARPADAFEWLRARLGLSSPHDQLRADLLARLARLDDPRVSGELLRWAREQSAGTRARAAAARGLGRFVPDDPVVRSTLVDLLGSRLFALRAATLEALTEAPTPDVLRVLEDYYAHTVVERERRTIERAFQAGARP